MGSRQVTGAGSRWRSAAAYAAAAAALLWVFHDVDLQGMLRQLRGVNAGWIVAAVAADIASYVCEGERWRLLLSPSGNLTLPGAVQAIYAGLFTNEVLPLRFGEVVRAWLASRYTGLPVTAIIPSMAIGRLIDAVWLALGVGALLFYVPLPARLEEAGSVFGAAVLLLAAGFILVVLRPPAWARRWVSGGHSKLRSGLARVCLGISEIGLSRPVVVAAFFSLALLLLQAAAFWFVMLACRLPVTFAVAAAVFVIVHLGTAIPNAPANVGSFQFFTVLGLQLFGVEKSTAAGFSVIVFVVLTLPLWALGALALSRTGTSLRRLRELDAGTANAPPPTFARLERGWSQRPF